MKTPIATRNVTISNGNLDIAAYLATPTAGGTYPAIVVVQEIFGVNDHIRDVTERIAREGYVAIAPAIFQRTAPGFEAGYTPEDVRTGREYKRMTRATELESDIQATIDFLYRLPEVKKGGVGTIGFCFGGHVVYLVSTLDDIAVTASFYGAGIATETPGGGPPTVTRTPHVKGTLYAFFGREDESIPETQVLEIENALKRHGVSHRLFRYDGAGHGFFCDRRSSHAPGAAADAWERVLELFERLKS
jgi:carboxymethylenebutenolidase